MFLAMTEDEIRDNSQLPSNIAFLGCHFSSTGSILTGLPESLPAGCGIILDDRNPITSQNLTEIADTIEEMKPAFLLLDFQLPPADQSLRLAQTIVKRTIPTAMPPAYGKELTCSLLLPPVPPHIPIEEYLHPWRDREVWLELALDAVRITVTSHGSTTTYFPHAEPQSKVHKDSMLHCHFLITQHPDALEFYCYRAREDITELRNTLPDHVTHTIGLYQELGDRQIRY